MRRRTAERVYKPMTFKRPPSTSREARGALVQSRRGGATFSTVPRSRGIYGIRGETKYFDSELDATTITAVTTTWPAGTMKDPSVTPVAGINTLFCPKDGSAINQRIGRQVFVTKIKIHGQISVANQSGVSTADPASLIRLLLVQDTQTNAAQMTAASLLQDGASVAATINTFQNLSNFGRYRVLKDKFFTMQNPNMANDTGATGGCVQAGLVKNFKISIKFRRPVQVRFNATNGGTIADIVDNSFHLICGTNNATIVPQLAYYSRICYTE